ncbi:MAG TPA: SpoIIE family protein phosphatase [Actinocatenispora sp.]
MSTAVHRRLRLPADYRSPAAARAAVRDILIESGQADLLDEALLLTTELSTNGVIHAGTDLDVDVSADERGVTVTVTDYRGGPIEANLLTPPDETSEHGRGLLLVDQFATSWGTTHDPTGKGVWFRLERGGPPARTRYGQPTRPRPDSPEALATGPADALVWLVHIPEDLRQRLTLPQLLSELLLRLCEVIGAAGGAVYLDSADGRGERCVARQGTAGLPIAEAPDGIAPPPDSPGETDAPPPSETVPLPLPRPLSGRIELHTAADAPLLDTWPSLAQLSAERMAIAVENDRLRDADRLRRSWLTYLAEASELLAQSLDVQLTLALVPQLVVPRLGEWCALHMLDEYGDLRLVACTHADEGALPLLRRLLSGHDDEETTDRLVEAARGDGVVALSRPVEGVAVPLIARGGVLGTLSVGRPPGRLHAPDDVAVISDIARRAALAIENARIHAERAEVSQAFQRALLPSALPTPAGLQFAAEYEPASTGTDVGGDFYDVVDLGGDQWLMCIGDVCGKGAQAAALTGLVRDVVRVLTRDGRPLDRVVELLNQTLLDQHKGDRYCTLAMAVVTRDADGALDVELCLSGHDRPVLVPRAGAGASGPESVGECGTAVGLLEDVVVTPVKIRLAPGDALVFYTDGVTERRRDSVLFGHHRLLRELGRLAGQSAASIAARLTSTVLSFSPDPPRDDIAILVLRNDSAPVLRDEAPA